MFNELDATLLVFIGYCLGARFDPLVALWPSWMKFILGLVFGLGAPFLFRGFNALRRWLA